MAIIEAGRSRYQIVTPGRRAPVETHAAGLLQEALARMTGVRLPVRGVDQRVPRLPAIRVGGDDVGPDGDLWAKDRFEIVPEGDDLLLRGVPVRATHYAVHAFLESLGARYFGPDSIVYPRRDVVPFPAEAVRSTAAFSHRHVFYPTAQEPEWAIRWGLNVHDGRDPRWGENAAAHSFGHSFARLVPLERHFAAHPEYFSLVDGRRRDRGQQLCCTNPAVADVACETMAGWIAAHPDRRIFAVGMNDWAGWCECPACAAVDRREGGPTGQLLTLVNRVAERFPDRIIATLAYAWAIDPPARMEARDNVLIVLCHNDGCFTHALDGCAANRRFLDRIRGWKEKARRILIWDYYVNYHSYLMPTPNLDRIQRDLRLYRDLAVEGMFCQGSACRGGQFEGLRQYLQARLLWDPDRAAWPLIEEWVTGVYGAGSGAAILEYLRMLEKHVAERDIHMLSFGSGQEIQETIFTPEILSRGKAMWDRAEAAAASDPGTARRVFAARAPEMCARLFHAGLGYVVRDGRFGPEPEPDTGLRDRFAAAAIAGDAAHLRENDGAPEDFARAYGRSYEAVELESSELHAVVIPELGGRLLSLVYRPLDLELLRRIDPVRFVNFGPYDAGYEFSLDPRWHGRGTAAVFAVTDRDAAGVTLETRIGGTLRLRTRYVLNAGTIHIEHTADNAGDRPEPIAACTHPEWAYAAFGDAARLRLRNGDGTWRETAMNPERRADRDLVYAGDVKPESAWEMTSAVHPIGVREAFDASAVQACALVFSARGGNLNLELHFNPAVLPPGGTARFRTAWTIAPWP